MAFKLNFVEDQYSKAAWDSDNSDYKGPNSNTFNKGFADEKAIYADYDPEEETPHFIIFFDENKNRVGNILPLRLKDEYEGEGFDYDSQRYFYVEEDSEQEYTKITNGYIFVVVNAAPAVLKDIDEIRNFDNLKDFSVSENELFYSEEKPYFTMSSSMVVKNGKWQPATDSNGDMKFKFYSGLNNAEANPYSLYVERLQAKYTVTFINQGKTVFLVGNNSKDETQTWDELVGGNIEQVDYSPVSSLTYTPSGKVRFIDSYDRSNLIDDRLKPVIKEGNWKVSVVGWGINALESDERLFKYMEDNNYFTNWKYSDYRSLWGEDLHYTQDNFAIYPDQYYIAYKEGPNSIVRDESVKYHGYLGSPSLSYKSFNNLMNRDVRQYTTENTFDALYLLGLNPYYTKSYLRVGSHLIVGAQLLIDGFEYPNVYNSSAIDDNGLVYYNRSRVRDKYYMNDIYWTEEAYFNYVAEYLGYWMLTDENKKFFGPNDGYFYINEEGTKASRFNFIAQPACIKGGDAMVYLKPTGDLYIKNPDYVEPEKPEENENPEGNEETGDNQEPDGNEDNDNNENPDENAPDEEKPEIIPEYIKIYSINPESEPDTYVDKYTVLAYQHPELMAQCFKEGRMYYVAGSEHNLNSSTLLNKAQGIIDTGDYGTLRNNWYNFKINSITKPGTAVPDPTVPIVPNNIHEDNAVGVTLQIMNWHGIYSDVETTPQKPGNGNNNTEDENK